MIIVKHKEICYNDIFKANDCAYCMLEVSSKPCVWDQLMMGPTKYGTILFGPFKCRTNLLWDQQSLDVLPFLTDLSWSGVGSFTVPNFIVYPTLLCTQL
jgi:hypothetical protein